MSSEMPGTTPWCGCRDDRRRKLKGDLQFPGFLKQQQGLVDARIEALRQCRVDLLGPAAGRRLPGFEKGAHRVDDAGTGLKASCWIDPAERAAIIVPKRPEIVLIAIGRATE